METQQHYYNDYHLSLFARSIAKDPKSWTGWKMLHICLGGVAHDRWGDCLHLTSSIAGSYLKDIEWRLYMCESDGMHLACRYSDMGILDDLNKQLCDLIYSETGVTLSAWIYDLARDGALYAEGVMDCLDETLGEAAYVPAMSRPLHIHSEAAPHKEGALLKPRILLVEDDAVTRWMVDNALGDMCDMQTAMSGNTVFAMYNSFQPDLVFLDINLPDHSGTELLDWILQNDPGANVVMFSSNNTMDTMTRALDNGAAGFIGKPFLKEQLLDYVSRYAPAS